MHFLKSYRGICNFRLFKQTQKGRLYMLKRSWSFIPQKRFLSTPLSYSMDLKHVEC